MRTKYTQEQKSKNNFAAAAVGMTKGDERAQALQVVNQTLPQVTNPTIHSMITRSKGQ